jgi:hypothetical protein
MPRSIPNCKIIKAPLYILPINVAEWLKAATLFLEDEQRQILAKRQKTHKKYFKILQFF